MARVIAKLILLIIVLLLVLEVTTTPVTERHRVRHHHDSQRRDDVAPSPSSSDDAVKKRRRMVPEEISDDSSSDDEDDDDDGDDDDVSEVSSSSVNHLEKERVRELLDELIEEERENAEAEREAKEPCAGCAVQKRMESLSEENQKKMRIELIKQQILMKLKMSQPPNATLSPRALPLPLSKGNVLSRGGEEDMDISRDVDDFYGKTEQVIIFPEEKDASCLTKKRAPAACFTFILPQDISPDDISTAQLWVFKLRDEKDKKNQSFIISEVRVSAWDVNHSAPPTRHITTQTFDIKEGWMKFDIYHQMHKWIGRSHERKEIQISCKTCAMEPPESPVGTRAPIRPFIVINTSAVNKKRRTRRNINCTPGVNECCRESLYINFEDIGWDSWIIEPKGYEAYYCRGSCANLPAITQSQTHHASIMQRYLQQLGGQEDVADVTPCCTATHMSAMSLVYIDNENIVKKNLPNMIVQSCGCL